MARTVLCLVLSALVIIPMAGALGQTGEADRNPPELRVLASRIGVWETQTTVKPCEAVPQGSTTKGVSTTRWVLGGRFQQSDHANRPAAPDAMFLVTYDSAKKCYRAWRFDDEGNKTESQGQWDKTTQTLTWTWENPDGSRATAGEHLGQKDSITWEGVAKSKEGKVLMEVGGTMKRKK